MKAILPYLLLSIIVLSQCTKEIPNIIDIPDPYFLAALIDQGIDSNNDLLIDEEEAEAVNSLIIGPSGIKSLKGIEAFTMLDSLNIHLNSIDTLDLSPLSGLIYLDCYSCEIQSLNVSQNLRLKELYCSRNKLTTLDVSSNTQLEKLILTVNFITEFDISKNTKLTTMMSCGNQLSYLDISNNILLERIGIDNMPELTSVCVWTLPFPPSYITILMGYSPNVTFTTTCAPK